MQPLLHVEDPAADGSSRLRSAWRAAHEPVAGVSHRLQRTAYAVPLIVFPASVWRLPAALDDGISLGERMYIPSLSILSEVLAFTAIGLIARWGEVFPRWIPLLRGRQVPTWAAVLPASIGAVILTLLFTVLAPIADIRGTTIRGDDVSGDAPTEAGGWELAWFYACYTPLILWGPLLALLTVAYYRRRRRAGVPAAA
ncbi:hypothetical protein DMB38_28570 [Streptomyces sp. WAC 06738]|uniref:hypothetical protein n=1 Tax=Streptomyces sp. WAC 06738 TaxID=2203210 RepID=UPI000F6D122A|nr:hypothetical protein [Streptomyces sp. WAC 06738]AZM49214.1 hypothetical protein DMB38_28570 [Streptomyces sp. WAC 06738]